MKRFILLVAALVAAMAMIGGGSAATAAGTSASCVVEGATGDLKPEVQINGGSGAFTFDGSVTCQLNGSPQQETIHAEGTYTNSVCGTGSAEGKAWVTNYVGPNSDQSTSFSIQFTSGLGIVTVAGSPAGAVQLLPTGPSSNVAGGGCVSQFTVAGAFSI